MNTKSEPLVWIRGFENLYAVSRNGEIISMKGGKGHRMSTKVDKNGVSTVFLRKWGKGYLRTVAKIVLMAYNETDNKDLIAFHINGNKQDNRLDNLRWESRSALMSDLGKPVKCKNAKTGEYREFKNAAEAGRQLGIDGQYIVNTINLNKKRGTGYKTAGWLVWRD